MGGDGHGRPLVTNSTLRRLRVRLSVLLGGRDGHFVDSDDQTTVVGASQSASQPVSQLDDAAACLG